MKNPLEFAKSFGQILKRPATESSACRTMIDIQTEKPLTTGEWVVTHLVLLIPIVNIVMHFVWAFGDGNISRRNFCRARLLLFAIGLGIAMLIGLTMLLFTGVFAGLMSQAHR